MAGWWPLYGEPSLIAGIVLGLMWAWFSARRRRREFGRAGLKATSQIRWFVTSFLSMGSYLTLIVAVALMAFNEVIAPEAMYFLLGAAGIAFCTALLFHRFQVPEHLGSPPRVQPVAAKVVQQSASAKAG